MSGNELPESVRYLVVGSGIHGLSTAWHLGVYLEQRGLGSGADVCVIDKGELGAGASGIACGVVRNNYFQPAMRELMAHSVAVWESDPKVFSYHPVGYLQIASEAMAEDVAQIYAEQQSIGYESELVTGGADCDRYMKGMFDDWQAQGIEVVLHEKRGGYANNLASLQGLLRKARAEGVSVVPRVTVTGINTDGGAVTSVETDRGTIACDHLVVAVGPWVRDFWTWLDLPGSVEVRAPDGSGAVDQPMWTYWALEEGTLAMDPASFLDNAGHHPPVVHVDTDAPLIDDIDGHVITDQMWGIYYKPDFNFGGIQGGASPQVVQRPAAEVRIDPYGVDSPEFVVDQDFVRMWTSALAHCQKRFEGQRPKYRKEPSGGIGAFTPDSFPIFDTFRQNAYVIADSNHGYKMIGVGDLVAREVLGDEQPLLKPFRFSRYAEGALHPTSHSPFPWS